MAATRKIHGPAVRAIRVAQGVRHGELAQRARVNPGYLTLIEQGKRQPSQVVISRIAAALGLALDDVTYLTEEEDVA